MSRSTIATAILEIMTDTGKMSAGLASGLKDVKAFGSKVESVSKQVNAVWGAMSAAMGVLALGAVGKQFLDFAGEVSDLSQRLQVSTDTVQEWQATFGKAGVPIESVAKSSEILSQKINGGDKSAVAAIKAMGLSVSELQAMRPEDRFIKVADAVGQLTNQDDRIAASKGLFGKGGPELLAALDGHLGETIEQIREMGLVIDGETIKAADDFGDQLGLMGKQLLGIVATVIGPLLPALSALGNVLSWLGRHVVQPILNVAIKSAMTLLAGFVEVVTGLLSRLASLGSNIPGVGDKFRQMAAALDGVSKKTGAYMVDLWKQKDATEATGVAADLTAPKIAGLGAASDGAAKQHRSQTDALAKLAERIDQVNRAAAAGLFKGPEYNPAAGELPGLSALRAYVAAIEDMRSRPGGVLGLDPHTIEQSIAGAGALGLEQLGAALPPIISAGTESGFARGIAAFPQLLQQAFTGGGGISGAFKAAGAGIGGFLGEGLFKAGGLLNGLGNKLAGVFGSSLGLALPGIGQVVGSLLGAALPKVWAGIKKLFGGPSQQELQGRELTKQFQESMGGFEQMMRTLGDDAALIGRPRAEIERLVKAMLEAEKKGPEAVKPWLEELQKIHDEAERARAATEEATAEATRAAAEASQARMTAAEQEITDLLDKRNELARGIAAEAAEEDMGVIERAQRTELAGLDAQLQQKAEAYAQLAQDTGLAMADAIVEALRAMRIEPVHVPAIIDFPDGAVPTVPAVPMAAGGFGRVTGPTLFYSAGQEDFAFSGEGKRFGADSFGLDVSSLRAELAGLRREMGQQVGMAVVHALAKYGTV